LLYFGSFSLLVRALLLTVSALAKRPELRLHFGDRPRKVGQLACDRRYVLIGCHLAQKFKLSGKVASRDAIRRSGPRSPAHRRPLGDASLV
jgi:hypothetical protein